MKKYRQVAREVKPLIVMIVKEDPSTNILEEPAQNPL